MPDVVEWTPEMVFALPDDGQRYEIVDGELLVTPSPGLEHQTAVGRLFYALYGYAEAEGRHATDDNRILVLTSPSDIRAPKTMLQPDVFAVRRADARAGFPIPLERILLAVEVLSPSNRQHDLVTKRDAYRRAGIPVYWIVDPADQCVHVWHVGAPEPITFRDELRWRPAGSATIFAYPLATLFAPI
ncbi:MAG: Uma2 family endonuclease [Gemmatimonadetes bacterium]|nr:Uma2 family endonuclease [Gemmatimonadota bacterium]